MADEKMALLILWRLAGDGEMVEHLNVRLEQSESERQRERERHLKRLQLDDRLMMKCGIVLLGKVSDR